MSTIDNHYDNGSGQYSGIADLPAFDLEWEIVAKALGDCTGKTVLDLGGGTGLHARQAIDHGAAAVDNVDISPGMLEEGKATSKSLGRSNDPIRWLVGDMSKSLEDLGLKKEGYDIVMVGWAFDHAETPEQLEDMWRNASRYTKPGGTLINVRTSSVTSGALQSGKYGTWYTDVREIPGGFAYTYILASTPVFTCPGTTMKANMDFNEASKLAERHGFLDSRKIDAHELEVVKKDRDFWQLYLDEPWFDCVLATKKA